MHYTNDGECIRADCEMVGDEVTVSISNTGCTLSPEDVEHVFDFFWRKSPSRSETGRHCGIGLSVAKKVAIVLGGALEVEVQGDLFVAHLTLPA